MTEGAITIDQTKADRFEALQKQNKETTADQALEILQDCFRVGPTFGATLQWGNGRRGFGLRFDLGGIGRFGSVVGWIVALAGSKGTHDFAVKAALDFVRALDYLANYGGLIDDQSFLPQHIIELGDDGMMHSFRLCWYRGIDLTNAYCPDLDSRGLFYRGSDDKVLREWCNASAKYYVYRRGLNGGLNYSGPDAGQTYTVNLTPSKTLWSVNT